MVIYVVLVLTPNYEILEGGNCEYTNKITHHLLRSKENIFLGNIFILYFENGQRTHVSGSAYMCCHSAPDCRQTSLFFISVYNLVKA